MYNFLPYWCFFFQLSHLKPGISLDSSYFFVMKIYKL